MSEASTVEVSVLIKVPIVRLSKNNGQKIKCGQNPRPEQKGCHGQKYIIVNRADSANNDIS